MGSDVKVEDMATLMASLSKLEDFGNISISSISSISYLFIPPTSCRAHSFRFGANISWGTIKVDNPIR
jgi:hypothetical protein